MFTRLRTGIAAVAAALTVVALPASAGERQAGVVSFALMNPTFDQYEAVLESFSAVEFTGTVFVSPSLVGEDDTIGWNELKVLKRAGWSIGVTTVDPAFEFEGATPEAIAAELEGAQAAITAAMGSEAHFFTTQHDKLEREALQAVGDYYSVHLAEESDGYNNVTYLDPLRLKRVTFDADTATTTACSAVQEVRVKRQWRIIMFAADASPEAIARAVFCASEQLLIQSMDAQSVDDVIEAAFGS